jgi:hypothetical protein
MSSRVPVMTSLLSPMTSQVVKFAKAYRSEETVRIKRPRTRLRDGKLRRRPVVRFQRRAPGTTLRSSPAKHA